MFGLKSSKERFCVCEAPVVHGLLQYKTQQMAPVAYQKIPLY